jgi:hypothetical protein
MIVSQKIRKELVLIKELKIKSELTLDITYLSQKYYLQNKDKLIIIIVIINDFYIKYIS